MLFVPTDAATISMRMCQVWQVYRARGGRRRDGFRSRRRRRETCTIRPLPDAETALLQGRIAKKQVDVSNPNGAAIASLF